MSGHIRWLMKELDVWLAEGTISPEQAEALRRRYAARESAGLPWGLILFGGLGAVVLGLGVILLFAYNWHEMGKELKLAVVFGALLLAHGAGLALRRRDAWLPFAEAMHLLGTMMFGAGIWLVAQIYHISSHYPNAFLVWAIGTLLLAWILPSISHGLLAAVLLTIWGCCEGFGFNVPQPLAPLLALAGCGWLAWRERSPVLLIFSAVAVTVTTQVAMPGELRDSFWYSNLFGLSLLLLALAPLTRGDEKFPAATTIFRWLGLLLFLGTLYLFSFHDLTRNVIRNGHDWEGGILPLVAALAAPLLALLAAGLALRNAARQRESGSPETLLSLWLPAVWMFGVLVMGGYAAAGSFSENLTESVGLAASTIANLLFLAIVLRMMWRGVTATRAGLATAGALAFGLLVFGRYFDLFTGLVSRGLMFIVVGLVLFLVALRYYQVKKRHAAALAEGKEANS
jgi:uncharacterized membrane protein